MKRLFTARIALAGLLVLGALVPALAESDVRITSIHVPTLTPLSVSFDVETQPGAQIPGLHGTVTLSDAAGREVDRFAVDVPAAAPGGVTHVRAASRWEFQLAGMYLVRIALDLGAGDLVTASLKLQILPVKLPLAPETTPPAPDAYVVYQKPSSWGFDIMHVPDAWQLSHGSPSVVVAVIDSGIDFSVPQLASSMWTNADEVPDNGEDDDQNGYVDDTRGWDFRDEDSSSLTGSPIHRHGTAIGSIIAAQPGRYPVVGIAPGVKLMDLRFLDSENQFSTADWAAFERAVNYAVENGANIINLSIFANNRPPPSFERALDRARARGIPIVGISGNLGGNSVMYPARYDSVLAVSALAATGLLAPFSNRGPEVDFCAPGEAVPSLAPRGRVAADTGTSFAAPHVTGVLALMLSVNPTLTADSAVRILADTAVDLGPRGHDDLYGFGLIDARAAVLAASGH